MPPDHEIYPVPLLPRLVVSDVVASTDRYEALGFDVVYSMPATAHVRYRKYADVMLADGSAIPSEGGRRRPDAAAVAFPSSSPSSRSRSTTSRRAPARTASTSATDHARHSLNTRDLTLSDGFEFVFSEGPVDADASFDEVVGTADREG